MFKLKMENLTREQEQQPMSNTNRVCQGTEIIGNINTPGDIRLDGSLEGNITAKGKVVIGNTGKIKGEIVASMTDIFGHMEGSMSISDIISLKSTANVKGNIVTAKISIEAGALFNGTCSMPDTKTTAVPQKKQ